MKMPSNTEQGLLESLRVREISGRDLAKEYERVTGKPIPYGTLYTTLRRMCEAGWAEARDADEGDRRVRLFKITGNGHRMAQMVAGLKAESSLLGDVPA